MLKYALAADMISLLTEQGTLVLRVLLDTALLILILMCTWLTKALQDYLFGHKDSSYLGCASCNKGGRATPHSKRKAKVRRRRVSVK